MPSTKSEAERTPTLPLANQYRAIGPAAIVAALICASKKQPVAILRKAA